MSRSRSWMFLSLALAGGFVVFVRPAPARAGAAELRDGRLTLVEALRLAEETSPLVRRARADVVGRKHHGGAIVALCGAAGPAGGILAGVDGSGARRRRRLRVGRGRGPRRRVCRNLLAVAGTVVPGALL